MYPLSLERLKFDDLGMDGDKPNPEMWALRKIDLNDARLHWSENARQPKTV
jgi:hypothetical protein